MKTNKLTDEEKKERKRLYAIEYRKKNADKINQKNKEYREANKDKIKEYDKKRYLENREENLKKQKEKRNTTKRIYSDEQKLAKKLSARFSKEKIMAYMKEYSKRKRKEDPLFKLKANLRSRIYDIFRNKNLPKNSSTEQILSCSFIEFKQYLESKFESWMNWDNYGLYNGTPNYGWDIDHIIPMSKGLTEDEVIKLNHYTNLQPLCSYYNRDIKKHIF